MTIHQLIERLLREPFCKLIPRTPAPANQARRTPARDVAAFYHAFAGGDIYVSRGNDGLPLYGGDHPVNGWELLAEPFERGLTRSWKPARIPTASSTSTTATCSRAQCDDLSSIIGIDLERRQFGSISPTWAPGYGSIQRAGASGGAFVFRVAGTHPGLRVFARTRTTREVILHYYVEGPRRCALHRAWSVSCLAEGKRVQTVESRE